MNFNDDEISARFPRLTEMVDSALARVNNDPKACIPGHGASFPSDIQAVICLQHLLLVKTLIEERQKFTPAIAQELMIPFVLLFGGLPPLSELQRLWAAFKQDTNAPKQT